MENIRGWVSNMMKIRDIGLGYLVVRPTCLLLISMCTCTTCTCIVDDHKRTIFAVIIINKGNGQNTEMICNYRATDMYMHMFNVRYNAI